MKVLIVSQNEQISDLLLKKIENANAAGIVYHSILKALDNLEEIAPDATVINTTDYPRHWKVFVQFEKTLKKNIEKNILLATSPISESEKEKASVIKNCILIPHEKDSFSEKDVETILSELGLFSKNVESTNTEKQRGSILLRIQEMYE